MKLPKIHANIRTQVLFMSSGIVLVSFLTFLPYVIFKFTDDKAKYLFERVQQMSSNAQEKTDSIIEKYTYHANFLSMGLKGIHTDDSLTPFLHLKFHIQSGKTQLIARNENKSILAKYTVPEKTENQLLGINISDLEFKNRQTVTHFQLIETIPVLSIFIKSTKSNTIDAFRFAASEITPSYKNSEKVKNFLIDSKNNVVLGESDLLKESGILEKILNQKSAGSSVEETVNGISYLIATSNHRATPWVSITLVEKNEVYSILGQIKKKLAGIAGIILSLSMLAGAFIAGNVIGPINQLLQGTREIVRKNYHHRIHFRKDNEFKDLAESFNSMSGEILNYIEEVKEKTRMEKELEVAELVQHSFLPPNGKVESKNIQVVGYYQSASECGGDWWDIREVGDKTLVFIADATGHGVPAALITSAAHSCSSMIPRMAETHPEILESPSKILQFFNDSIHGSGGTIHMTLFAGIYDKKTSILSYANASHLPPLLYRFSESTPSKTDLHPLLDSEGFRLGHKADSRYTEGKIVLQPKDVIYLYTDGFTEAVNADGVQFGDRRFQKKLLEQAKNPLESQMNMLISELQNFISNEKPNDDISLVMIARK